MVSGVQRWTNVGPGYNWDGWPSSGAYTISGCNQPTRSTQPCIPSGSLNRVPASAGVTAGMSPLPGVWSHMACEFPQRWGESLTAILRLLLLCLLYTTLWFIHNSNTYFRMMPFSDIHISQGSLATCLKRDGIFKHEFVANLLPSPLVKQFDNSWWSYG